MLEGVSIVVRGCVDSVRGCVTYPSMLHDTSDLFPSQLHLEVMVVGSGDGCQRMC